MKLPNTSHLLSKNEVENVFKQGHLYLNNSFYIIELETAEYDLNKKYDNYLDQAHSLSDAFLNNQTIIVRNMENYNEAIRLRCAKLGRDVDVHMYLTPSPLSKSFKFHTDERKVVVHVLFGEKKFILIENSKEVVYFLKEGEELVIPKGMVHRAISMGESCILSFGIEEEVSFQIPCELSLKGN